MGESLMKSEETLENERKGIPSKVFYNYFDAISTHIYGFEDCFGLKKVDYFNKLKLRNENFNIEKCRKLLWNSWSTEYALNITSMYGNSDYYKCALHWNFPQAYYSIYLAMTAFHETQGKANEQHEKSIKVFGNSVKDGHYPECISFFSGGSYKNFKYYGLSEFTGFARGFNALERVGGEKNAQNYIASFLKTTRGRNAKNKRVRAENGKDKRFLNANGEFSKRFTKNHWDLIYITIPETTILNILYRLRIKANYHDIETFTNADIDFQSFHTFLRKIVMYLNFVHEAYLCKVVGKVSYKKMLYEFKGHLNNELSKKRYEVIQSLCKN